MYKVYINDTPLRLVSASDINATTGDARRLVARYGGKPKFLFHYIDLLEKSQRFEEVILYADDAEQLWRDFQAQYQLIEAAGGVVFNPRGEALLLFRRGSWDLPKGKIDPGETVEQAALREVREETGLQHLEIIKPLPVTYHTYRQGRQRILKRTYWFEMKTPDLVLVPQTEEDIELAVWRNLNDFLPTNPMMYASIKEILYPFLQQKS